MLLIHSEGVFCCCLCAGHSIVNVAVETFMKYGGRDGWLALGREKLGNVCICLESTL